MGKFKFNLRDFVRAMKKGNQKQLSGYLFGLDNNGDLCGCALGQGLINSGLVDTDEIRQALKPMAPSTVNIITEDGKIVADKIRVNGQLESEWMNRLNDDLGSDFTAAVVSTNDPGHTMHEVIEMIFNKFGDRLA